MTNPNRIRGFFQQVEVEIMVRRIVILGATVATIAANFWVNAAPLFGRSTQEVSAANEVMVTPAGWAFAIWGLIYVLLLAFALYQFRPGGEAGRPDVLDRVFWPYLIASAANIVWLVLWHGLMITATLAAMLVLLLSLITIYVRLDVGRAGRRGLERLMVEAPFSVYLGWISVATIVNVSIVLSKFWDGSPLSADMWAALLCLIAAGLAGAMAVRHRDVAYPLVILWALLAIADKQGDASGLIFAAGVAGAFVAAGAAMWAISGGRRRMAA